MTTEPPITPDPPPAEQTPATPPMVPAPAPGPSISASGESLVMVGSLLVLASWLVFQLIAGEFFQYITSLVAAAFGVLVPVVGKEGMKGLAPAPVLMKALGYVIAVSGAFEILYDIRFEVLDEPMAWFGAIVAYVGYVVAFIGARTIKT